VISTVRLFTTLPLLLLLLPVLHPAAQAQEEQPGQEVPGIEAADQDAEAGGREQLPEEPLPYGGIGFLGLRLGMSREQALATADASDLLQAPRRRDVEFFPADHRRILTLSVRPEVPFIYLQFFDDVLYAITVIFDDAYVDYHTLADTLAGRYGAWERLQPDSRLWRVGEVTVRVEKPAVVKYIALEDFLQAAGFDGDRPEGRARRLLEGL
jgi:hypothetical protein